MRRPANPLIRALRTFCMLLLGGGFLVGCATRLGPVGGTSVSAGLTEVERPGGARPERDVQARQLFIRGLTRAHLGDHERAVGYFEEALRLAPGQAAVLSALAASHEALNDLDTAIFYARQAQAQGPENLYYHQHLARLYLSHGDTAQASETYRALLQRFPNDYESLFDLARLQTAGGHYEEALATYEALLDVVGDNPDVLHRMLQLYRRRGDEAGMARTLEEIIEVEPGEGTYYRMLGDLYVKRNDLQQAAAVLERAVRAAPDDLESVTALADVYRRQGRAAEAERLMQASVGIEGASAPQLVARAAALMARPGLDAETTEAVGRMLERAVELAPEQADALVLLGELRLRQEDHLEAAGLFYRALTLNPRAPDLWYRCAAAFLEGGDARRAAEVADEAIFLFPGQVDLLRLAGQALMASYQNDEAIRRFDEALHILTEEEAVPRDRADVLASLALLQSRKRNDAAADSLYARALAVDPNHAVALNNYAYSLSERPDALDEARRLAERALTLDPDNPSFMDTLGWILFKLGRLDEAARWLGRAVETGAASATVYEHYGDLEARRGDQEAARRLWRQALEMNPASDALQRKLEGRTP